jgi:hypothetical protein
MAEITRVSSKLLDKLLETYDEEELRAYLIPPSPLEWAKLHRNIGDAGFSLDLYPCMKQIYEDNHDFKVIQKPAQVGVSEYLLNVALHAMDGGYRYYKLKEKDINVGYIFPTTTALQEFSKERIAAGILEENEYLSNIVKASETGKSGLRLYSTLHLYRIGGSFLHMRGAANPTVQLKSFPVDYLIIDELDEVSDRAVALALRRLGASDLRYKLFASTPTYPGVGINYYYTLSDQHVWELKCPHCGLWQEPDFFKNVLMDSLGEGEVHYEEWQGLTEDELARRDFTFVCQSCRKEMDRLATGRWRSCNPGSYIRGYRIPGLVSPKVPLREYVINSKRPKPADIQEFWNSDLGLPYAPKGGSLSLDELMRCEIKGATDFRPFFKVYWSTMGIDVGAKLHVKVSTINEDGRWETVLLGEYDEFEELDEIISRYKVGACVVDAYPETRKAKEFAEKYKGKVWLAKYPSAPQIETAIFRELRDDDPTPYVDISRTEAMDEVANSVVEYRETWPELVRHQWPQFYRMMQAPVKVKRETTKKDGSTEIRYVYQESGPDHFYHAFVYEYVARIKCGGWTIGEEVTIARPDISPLKMEF